MNVSGGISIILLAGGVGSRFDSKIPKQFLLLSGQPVAQYSYRLFSSCQEVSEIVVVCAPEYQNLFQAVPSPVPLQFALPGTRRQDSVFNGLQAVRTEPQLICVHDSARPFITKPLINCVFAAAKEHGAATVGLPVKFTVKETDGDQFACHTPDRSNIWEIQTPQVIRTDWLKKGFHHIQKHQLTVTDDVSVVEKLGFPVKLVEGDDQNLKITTKNDFFFAEKILERRMKEIESNG